MSDSLIIRFYTIDETAGLLNVSKETIYRLVESRILPSYKVKGCIRIAHEDIMNYLNANRRESHI